MQCTYLMIGYFLTMITTFRIYQELFKNTRYGLDRNGRERIIHSARCYNTEYQKQDQFFMDGRNSFNTSNRNGAINTHLSFYHLLVE